MTQESGSVVVATMGGQPQVITFALDALLAQGYPIREVLVLYLSADGSRVNRALERLAVEFEGDHYQGRPCRFRPIALRAGETRLPDIQSDADAIAASEMLRDLMLELKQERYQLHLCVSGGRRMLALLLVPLAMLYFGYSDRLWHMYTPAEFQSQARDGQIMHTRPEDGMRLIQVPLVPLGALGGAAVAQRPLPGPPADDPDWPICRAVWAKLSRRQRDVLGRLAAGDSPPQVAETLSISIKTFNTHQTAILAECRLAWGLPEGQRLDYHFIQARFGPYADRLLV